MQRRDFLKNGVVLTGLGLLAPSLLAQRAGGAFPKKFVDYGGEGPHPHLTYYNYESQAWFRKNNTVLTAYRANAAQKYPYWYPLAGPKSGLSLIAETGSPWPHHRGVFFGCDRVNGGNYWQNALKDGKITSQGFKLESISEEEGVLTDHCLWGKPGQDPIIEDKRRFVLKVLDENRYILDAWLEVTPLVDITIQKTNHSLYGVRCSPDISATGGGVLENSNGARGQQDTFGKPAKWCTFYGKRAGLDITEGVAVLVPPEPFKDCQWFTRDYGNISPTPMQFISAPFKRAKGEVLKLSYRVVAYAGTPKTADLNGLWDDFVTKQG